MSALRVDPYEKGWMVASGILLFFFLLALAVSALYGFRLPDDERHTERNPTAADSPFAKPGIVERTPGRFDAYLWAQIWSFAPNEIKVPAGSTVTFHIASRDVQHSLLIERTNVNVMILPGQVTKIAARFDEPGEYRFFCAEYCGIAHQIMFGKVVVGPRP
jgi:cytochrome c oxidase subunit II